MATFIAVVVTGSVLLLTLGVSSSFHQHAPLAISAPAHEEAKWPRWLVRVGTSALAKKVPTSFLERRIELAGRPLRLELVLGLKFVLALGSAVLFAIAAVFNTAFVLLAPIPAVAAFRLPDMALARRAKGRLARLSDQVSDLADVLLVMTEAGVSPAVAFRRAAEILPDPLGAELDGVIRRLDLGIPWRSAMTEVAERSGVRSLQRLVRAIARSQRLGTSLASVLRRIADDLRAERRAEAELAARQAPVKMLFPLVFMILPAFLLLTVGPVVLSTIRSLS
ncbi:MAG TPA: type II secretion system F family protein [Actinomycetota bacterium]|nr:type II secretion system F family protein [Actinomycetota bacterium]